MKTLSDVIKEMQVDSNWGEVHLESCEKWMRRACEAIEKEIVPKQTTHFNFRDGESYSKSAGHNACCDEMIKNIAEFMENKK